MPTQFITDSEGHKISVILPIDEYQQLLEDLEDAMDACAALTEAKQNGFIDWEEIKTKHGL
ncbi:hypothetical protein [Methylosarcina fibrata]|uniref:hypothetical protein n=1 Tax=Methylosarcina fibrata TaxID=105972 RepID=UPI000377C838|nr:hypothetical protein [Methylosarcina fibrata]